MPLLRTLISTSTSVLVVVALSLLTSGCGSGGPPPKPTGRASGKVTFSGAPVTEGLVTLVDDATGNISQAEIDSSGTFTVNAIVGTYKVSVSPLPPPPSADINHVAQPKDPANIPRKYRSPATSELTATVKEGTAVLNLDLLPQKEEPAATKVASQPPKVAVPTPAAPSPVAATPAPANPTPPAQATLPTPAATTSAPRSFDPLPIAGGLVVVILAVGGVVVFRKKKRLKASPPDVSEEGAPETETVTEQSPSEGPSESETPVAVAKPESPRPKKAGAKSKSKAARSAAKSPAQHGPKSEDDALVDKYLFDKDDEPEPEPQAEPEPEPTAEEEEFDAAESGELPQDGVTDDGSESEANVEESDDHVAARAVLGLGGKIRVAFDNGEAHEIKHEEELPDDEAFHLIAIYLEGHQDVTDEICESFRDLAMLQTLDLAATPIGDAAVASFAQLTSLRDLALAKTAITDAGLESLRFLVHLKKLLLRRTKITDAGLEHLQALKELELLELKYTAVTDAGVDRLTGLSHLKQLFVGETSISDEGVARLQAALPECKIVK